MSSLSDEQQPISCVFSWLRPHALAWESLSPAELETEFKRLVDKCQGRFDANPDGEDLWDDEGQQSRLLSQTNYPSEFLEAEASKAKHPETGRRFFAEEGSVPKKQRIQEVPSAQVREPLSKTKLRWAARPEFRQLSRQEFTAGFTAFCALLENGCHPESFRTLSFHGHEIGDELLPLLTPFLLSGHCPLESLSLEMAQIGDLGAQTIAGWLTSPKLTLSILNLNRNEITEAGLLLIAQALQAHPSCPLKTLHLQLNPFSHNQKCDISSSATLAYMGVFRSALKANHTLTKLFLDAVIIAIVLFIDALSDSDDEDEVEPPGSAQEFFALFKHLSNWRNAAGPAISCCYAIGKYLSRNKTTPDSTDSDSDSDSDLALDSSSFQIFNQNDNSMSSGQIFEVKRPAFSSALTVALEKDLGELSELQERFNWFVANLTNSWTADLDTSTVGFTLRSSPEPLLLTAQWLGRYNILEETWTWADEFPKESQPSAAGLTGVKHVRKLLGPSVPEFNADCVAPRMDSITSTFLALGYTSWACLRDEYRPQGLYALESMVNPHLIPLVLVCGSDQLDLLLPSLSVHADSIFKRLGYLKEKFEQTGLSDRSIFHSLVSTLPDMKISSSAASSTASTDASVHLQWKINHHTQGHIDASFAPPEWRSIVEMTGYEIINDR